MGQSADNGSGKPHHNSARHRELYIVSNGREIFEIFVALPFGDLAFDECPQQIHLHKLSPQLFTQLVELALFAGLDVLLISFSSHPPTVLREDDGEENCQSYDFKLPLQQFLLDCLRLLNRCVFDGLIYLSEGFFGLRCEGCLVGLGHQFLRWPVIRGQPVRSLFDGRTPHNDDLLLWPGVFRRGIFIIPILFHDFFKLLFN